MPSIESQLLNLIQLELGVAPESVSRDTRLPELGDSLDWLSLISAVEDTYGIEITDEQSQSLATFGDLVQLVQEPLAA